MKNFTFSFPTQVIFGRDAETHAGALSAPFGPNVMLLYGSDRIRRSGLLGRLTADLEAHGLTVTLFGGIQENPVLSTAEEGRRLAKEKKITLLLAVGYGLMWVSVVLTVISGIQYVWTYRKYLTA